MGVIVIKTKILFCISFIWVENTSLEPKRQYIMFQFYRLQMRDEDGREDEIKGSEKKTRVGRKDTWETGFYGSRGSQWRCLGVLRQVRNQFRE